MVYDLIPDSIEGIAVPKLREVSGIPKTSFIRYWGVWKVRG